MKPEKTQLPAPLPGFEGIRRHAGPGGQCIARILPGEYYVTREDEVLDTVLGSCVAACVRHPRLGIGGMNHFMLPGASGGGEDAWESLANRATLYGSASMEQLINRILRAGGTRQELEVKIFGGANMLSSRTDIGGRNVRFVRDFLDHEGLPIISEDVGDACSRHVRYFPRSGRARVRRLAFTRTQRVESQEQRYLQGLENASLAGEIDLF